MKTFSTALVIVACAVSSAHGQECAIGSAALSVKTIDPRRLAGVFDLEWRPAAPFKRTPRRERLWLWPTSPNDRSLDEKHLPPEHFDTSYYPLYGFVTTRTIAASKVDSVHATVDPIHAPVYFDLNGSRADDDFVMSIVFNGIDRSPAIIMNDNGDDQIIITRIGQRGFAGYYRPYGMVMRDTGFACAIRVR